MAWVPQAFAAMQARVLASGGCPVEITARQRSVTERVETGGAVPAGPAQGLTVVMAGETGLRVVSAEVVAHALSPKSRAFLTATADDADVTRPFHLVAKKSGELRGDLWIEGVTSIRWIEVKSLTYSDGSVWRESETQRCSVRPDPLVLISSR